MRLVRDIFSGGCAPRCCLSDPKPRGVVWRLKPKVEAGRPETRPKLFLVPQRYDNNSSNLLSFLLTLISSLARHSQSLHHTHTPSMKLATILFGALGEPRPKSPFPPGPSSRNSQHLGDSVRDPSLTTKTCDRDQRLSRAPWPGSISRSHA